MRSFPWELHHRKYHGDGVSAHTQHLVTDRSAAVVSMLAAMRNAQASTSRELEFSGRNMPESLSVLVHSLDWRCRASLGATELGTVPRLRRSEYPDSQERQLARQTSK